MNFRILGPLEVLDDDSPVTLGGAKQRALLALLVLNAGEAVTVDLLIEELWGDFPPATAAKAVQMHVSRLRRSLGRDVVMTREHGYELVADADDVDACRFERLLSEGRRELAGGRPDRAAAALEEAAALWRGPPLADLAYEPFARAAIARLTELRVDAVEELIDAKLALGRHAETIEPLEQLVAEHPYRERARGQLMLALYRAERQAEALQAYQDARRTLVDDLGIEPGARLRELEQAILTQDASLALPVIEPVAKTEPAPRHLTPVAGRERELARVDATLDAAAHGLQVLMIEGDPGIGKTTVWQDGLTRADARGFRVLPCRTAQAETRLSFAGLSDLLEPVEAEAFRPLPRPQRHALEVALLRADADEAGLDPRAIGTGLVSLLSGLAEREPVLVAVDDVQWLDRPTARALEFASRRLEPARVAMLLTRRPMEDGSATEPISDMPADRLRLGPLHTRALYKVLREPLRDALTPPLLASIEQASRGNPFYALEIARAVRAGGPPGAGEPLPVPDDLRELVRTRLRALPERTRDELLKASALAQPTAALVDAAALAPAVRGGIVSVDLEGRVAFSHPLFAGAIQAAASPERRRRLHGELAELVTDVEERARHLCLAADGPDEDVAAILDEAADLAHRRGAPDVAAELEERAARLTPDGRGEVAWERSLLAARHRLKAGDPARARALAEEVTAAGPPPGVRARALHLLGEACTGGTPGASLPFLEEALACTGEDARQAATLELGLGLAFMGLADHDQAARHLDRAVELAESNRDSALLAETIAFREASRLFSGAGVDDRALERALALEDPDRDVAFQLRPSLMVASVYLFTGRIDVADSLLTHTRERILARGEEGDLPFVLTYLATTALLSGRFGAAAAVAEDAMRASALAGQEIFSAWALAHRAMARAVIGPVDAARDDGAEALAASERMGWPDGMVLSRWALGFVALSESDPDGALATLEPIAAGVEEAGVYEWPIACPVPDAIEALVETGDLARAARLTEALGEWGRRFDRPWALALSGRSYALLQAAAGDLDEAEAAARGALAEHERLPFPLELGRTLLVLGQIQSRRGDGEAARKSLEQSLAVFEQIGAHLWAAKAGAAAAGVMPV
ncbi:MAG: BTAD domain-containing putative transcriptional regulator [Thermoleophilaceae bacterium]